MDPPKVERVEQAVSPAGFGLVPSTARARAAPPTSGTTLVRRSPPARTQPRAPPLATASAIHPAPGRFSFLRLPSLPSQSPPEVLAHVERRPPLQAAPARMPRDSPREQSPRRRTIPQPAPPASAPATRPRDETKTRCD